VSIVDVDDLRTGAESAHTVDDVAVQARLDEAARSFQLWLQRRRIVPTLAMICENAESLRTSELSRIRNRLGTLDANQFAIIESMSKRLVGQLLHRPLATLAASPDSDELARSARRLFASDT
jgi:glutamyl-tRNA reductase